MIKLKLDGTDFTHMIFSGAQALYSQVTLINNLNVFPVPDGDTGTNMSLTLRSGIDLLNEQPSANISHVANVFAKGLLLGARGNSGVIMSQLFRGFARALGDLREINGEQFAEALLEGVRVAYGAVTKPVEGTILTVSREAAEYGMALSHNTNDMVELMEGILHHAKETLTRTPDMLAVLKQAGVVDSGGQGLVCLYEGFYAFLIDGEQKDAVYAFAGQASGEAVGAVSVPHQYGAMGKGGHVSGSAQAHFSTESIDFPYDMEFLIYLDQKRSGETFPVERFRQSLTEHGDSVVVIADEAIVKVHVHTDEPDKVLNLALQHGELGQFHIENMRLQHRSIVDGRSAGTTDMEWTNTLDADGADSEAGQQLKACGVVAVSMGEGISDIFQSLGVDYVVRGGQAMNPSTSDFVNSINKVQAQSVIILPNNSNIILAAEQARELVDKEVIVLPTVSMPQGIGAMFSFRDNVSAADNVPSMTRAVEQVKSGQITRAVRDAKFAELDIEEGNYIGLFNSKIVAAHDDIVATGMSLLRQMISDEDEILTIFLGEGVVPDQFNKILSFVEEHFPELEIETHEGGQPVYDYIFAVE